MNATALPPPATQHVRSVTFRDARRNAASSIAEKKGFKNRACGAFALPPAELAEPARTERLLKAPFALTRDVPADMFQQRAGSLFFRVNGGHCLGVGYRLIVVGVNMCVGALGGCKQLFVAGSAGAMAQVVIVFSLQLTLAFICFCVSPDADRVFSTLGGRE